MSPVGRRWSLFGQILDSFVHESLNQGHRPTFPLESLSNVIDLSRQIFRNNVLQ